MDIHQRNINAALRAAVMVRTLSSADHAEACRLITAGERTALAPSDATRAPSEIGFGESAQLSTEAVDKPVRRTSDAERARDSK